MLQLDISKLSKQEEQEYECVLVNGEELVSQLDALLSGFSLALVQNVGEAPNVKVYNLVSRLLEDRGLTVHRFQRFQDTRITEHCIFLGGVEESTLALEQMGVFDVERLPLDYPECLRGFLCRDVWKSCDVRSETYPLFIKPVGRKTAGQSGHVFHKAPTEKYVQGEYWCSRVIHFGNEFRVYVAKGAIVSIRCYVDWRSERVKMQPAEIDTVLAAIQAYEGAPAAYALDFGHTARGLALVEVTEGYSLGAYDTPPKVFLCFLLLRWRQLLSM